MFPKDSKIQPQTAYSAYMHGFKINFTFFNRTIPSIHNYLEVLRNNFIPPIL